MKVLCFLLLLAYDGVVAFLSVHQRTAVVPRSRLFISIDKVSRTEDEWKGLLSPESYLVRQM